MAGTYPSLTTYQPSGYEELEPDYPGSTTDYPDGGRDGRLHAPTPTRRFTITYRTKNTGVTETATFLAALRTLAANNYYNRREGSLTGFAFTPRGESALANVHFDEGGLEIRQAQGRSNLFDVVVRLIHRP